MSDGNVTLAKNLVNYSCRLQPKEKILIEAGTHAIPLIKEIIKEVYRIGGYPFVRITSGEVLREIITGTDREHSELMTKYMLPQISDTDAYIGISANQNMFELAGLERQRVQDYSIYYQKPIHHDVRVTKTKWVILQYPTEGFAQQAGKSTDNFKEFYYNVCNLNYAKMNSAMDNLKALMERTDRVKILSPGTDLHFSIMNIPAIKCAGVMNIPDGEIYTAPVKTSINGVLTYNVPTLYNGIRFDNVCLKFKDGKIIGATSSKTKELNEILDTDEGARYVGEFAIGVNPFILEPMLDILFDEKIAGSFHFTPGSCYLDAYNGNDSAIHWDMVQIQRKEYGGGEIWFDDVLIRKDGLFVLPELECLNPNNLV